MGHARTPKIAGIVYTSGVEQSIKQQCGNIRASKVCCQVKAKGEKKLKTKLFCTIDDTVIFYI